MSPGRSSWPRSSASCLAAALFLGFGAGCGGGAQTSPCHTETQQGEFKAPITIRATLDRPPSLEAPANLSAQVVPDRSYGEALFAVELPSTLRFAETPRNAAVRRRASDRGLLVVASFRGPLVKGRPRRVTARVRAVQPGDGDIVVSAHARISGGVDAGDARFFLTIGRTAAKSACRGTGGPVG